MTTSETGSARTARGGRRQPAAAELASFYRRAVVPWLFLLPILLLNAVVVLGPALSSVYYSLTDWNGVGAATYIGLENFRRLFFDDPVIQARLPQQSGVAGHLPDRPDRAGLCSRFSCLSTVRRGALLYRMTIFIPFVLPTVVVASIWRSLLSPRLGIGAQLAAWGFDGLDRAYPR